MIRLIFWFLRINLCLFFSQVFIFCGLAHAFPDGNVNCFKCHSLNKVEASEILRKINPEIRVISIKRKTIGYFWEVGIELNGKKGIIYIDLPKRRLISGNVIEISSKKNLTDESLSEINKVDVSKIPLGDALMLGNRNAKYKVIVFDDPE
jgi:thiol:disulfide interchange protein DsbC